MLDKRRSRDGLLVVRAGDEAVGVLAEGRNCWTDPGGRAAAGIDVVGAEGVVAGQRRRSANAERDLRS